MIAILLSLVLSVLAFGQSQPQEIVIIPSVETAEQVEAEWAEFHADAYAEYADEFTAIFDSLEFKVSKNGRSMIRRQGEKSFRFVAKGK